MRYIDEQVRELVLEKIRPTQAEIENQRRVIQILHDALVTRAKEIGQDYTFIEAQGSTGPKQTQLRGTADIDLFVGLDPSAVGELVEGYKAERGKGLSKFFDNLVETWFKPAAGEVGASKILKAYSQHPYLSLVLGGLDVDVIACFDLSAEELATDGPITAVDRTVHHTRYVTNAVNERVRDDIRVLKSFIRASHAYGDACAVGQMGFTGYSIEVITILGGGLDEAIDLLLKLEDNPVDPLNRSEKILRENSRLKDDYVIVIDPTDTNRNVASSFTPRTVRWVLKRLGHLLSLDAAADIEEVMNLILERPIPTEHLPKWIAPHAITHSLRADGTAHYTQFRDKLYRIARRIASELGHERTGETRFGEALWEIYFEGNTFSIGFLVEHPEIDDSYRRRGPPLRLKEAADEFRKRHPDAFEEGEFLWTIVPRRWTSARAFVERQIKTMLPKGFDLINEDNVVAARVLNTLYRYVMRVEEDFPLSKRQEYKEALQTLPW